MAHTKFGWSAVLNHHTLVSAQPSVPHSWRTGYKLAKSLTMDVQKDRLVGSTPELVLVFFALGEVGNGSFPTSHGSIVPYLKPATKFTEELLSFDRSLPLGAWDVVQLVKKKSLHKSLGSIHTSKRQ